MEKKHKAENGLVNSGHRVDRQATGGWGAERQIVGETRKEGIGIRWARSQLKKGWGNWDQESRRWKLAGQRNPEWDEKPVEQRLGLIRWGGLDWDDKPTMGKR